MQPPQAPTKHTIPLRIIVLGVVLVVSVAVIAAIRAYSSKQHEPTTQSAKIPQQPIILPSDHSSEMHIEAERATYYRTLACYWSSSRDSASEDCQESTQQKVNQNSNDTTDHSHTKAQNTPHTSGYFTVLI